jgi:hypothetical protein
MFNRILVTPALTTTSPTIPAFIVPDRTYLIGLVKVKGERVAPVGCRS